jgi:hypothetical protein
MAMITTIKWVLYILISLLCVAILFGTFMGVEVILFLEFTDKIPFPNQQLWLMLSAMVVPPIGFCAIFFHIVRFWKAAFAVIGAFTHDVDM